jgi:tetratricopeptide (TPR) repeat protein
MPGRKRLIKEDGAMRDGIKMFIFTAILLLAATTAGADDSCWLTCHSDAAALCSTGDLGEAFQQAKKGLCLAQEKYGSNHLNTAKSLEQLGEISVGWGRTQQADLYLNKALNIRRKMHGDSHPTVIKLLTEMADSHRIHRNYDRAEKLYGQAIDLSADICMYNSITASALEGSARLYLDQGRYSRAEPLFRKAIDIYTTIEKYQPSMKAPFAKCLVGLAETKWAQGDLPQARKIYKTALRKFLDGSFPVSPMIAYTYKRLGDLSARRGASSVAVSYYNRALGAYEKTCLPEGSFTAATLAGMADLLKSQGKIARATDLYNSAVAIYERTGGLNRELATMALTKGKIWPSFSMK